MARLRGWSRKGERCRASLPHGHWKTTTFTAGLRLSGLAAPMLLDGPMHGAAFRAYVEQVLLPELPADAIVVMDNLCAHKSKTTQYLFQEAGIELHYQPPYSPDFNPIELMWSKVKNSLRTAKARTQEQLYEAVAHALTQITSSDIHGFFRHCNVAIKS